MKEQIRFRDIVVDWKSTGISKEDFNRQGKNEKFEDRVFIHEGKIFVSNSIHCSTNELIEWTLINQNNLTELEVWSDTGGENLCSTETIFHEWFGLSVQSFSIEFIGFGEHEKIDLDLLSNDLNDTNTIYSPTSH